MKIPLILGFLSFVITFLTSFAFAEDLLQVGQIAPDFSAKTFDGQSISLSQLRTDGPVVLILLRSCS